MKKRVMLCLVVFLILNMFTGSDVNVMAQVPIGTPIAGVLDPTRAPSGRRHALLIAIQNYGDIAPFPSLKGALNDRFIVKAVLQARFGFQNQDFIILDNNKATHSGIEQAFKTLIARVQFGDFVYIHYSGHGSQTPDLNGDEPGGMDQTWVSYGARTGKYPGKDDYEVLDDEIKEWLQAIYAKTAWVVFVSDSCHSATVSRGEALVARAVEPDPRPHLLGKMRYVRPDRYPGIRIGAARDQESAIEFQAEDGNYYGIFTWYWVKAVQQAQTGETWSDVFKQASAQVTARRAQAQRPQFEGERGLQIGGGFTAMRSTIPVATVENEKITLQAGYLSGITAGSIYRLYNPSQPGSLNLPTLTITRVKTFESSGRARGSFQPGDLVVEESHVYPFPAIKVYVNADYPEKEDKPLLQAIQSAFQTTTNTPSALPAYTLTDDREQAEVHLYIVRPKLENGQYIREPGDGVLPKSFPEQPPEVWVLSPEHRLFYENLQVLLANHHPTKGMQVLQENLTKFARIRELKALGSSRDSKLAVAIDVYRLSPVASCQEGPDCVLLPHDLGFHRITGPYGLRDIQNRIFTKDEILTFTLRNESKNEYYCYLLDISPDGTVGAISPDPNAAAVDAIVKAGGILDLRNKVGLKLEETGEETIKCILSREPIDVALLEMQGFEKRGGTKGAYNPLEQLLVNAMYGQRGRVSLRNDEWATEQVSFEVK
jgi:hypothetical protein